MHDMNRDEDNVAKYVFFFIKKQFNELINGKYQKN